ncbi:MAG: hypothetical protein JO191_13440 [Mycobacteriaceae bacterium]|nr:hypothetical protein [Mycobacteriaceae bacterium]MBV9515857.1 hypothetical protein [Mycobacteriaceae bacterium]
MRLCAVAGAGLLAAAALAAPPPAIAEPTVCNVPDCTPGIQPGVVLGAPCDNTTYYVFGVTDWGRLVFCGSPRRYDPRWFRSPSMFGIKDENTNCNGYELGVAQAPDGLFLTCVPVSGQELWLRGDT